ncbi:unnamed protein product, partial [Polarella glacialis]
AREAVARQGKEAQEAASQAAKEAAAKKAAEVAAKEAAVQVRQAEEDAVAIAREAAAAREAHEAAAQAAREAAAKTEAAAARQTKEVQEAEAAAKKEAVDAESLDTMMRLGVGIGKQQELQQLGDQSSVRHTARAVVNMLLVSAASAEALSRAASKDARQVVFKLELRGVGSEAPDLNEDEERLKEGMRESLQVKQLSGEVQDELDQKAIVDALNRQSSKAASAEPSTAVTMTSNGPNASADARRVSDALASAAFGDKLAVLVPKPPASSVDQRKGGRPGFKKQATQAKGLEAKEETPSNHAPKVSEATDEARASESLTAKVVSDKPALFLVPRAPETSPEKRSPGRPGSKADPEAETAVTETIVAVETQEIKATAVAQIAQTSPEAAADKAARRACAEIVAKATVAQLTENARAEAIREVSLSMCLMLYARAMALGERRDAEVAANNAALV